MASDAISLIKHDHRVLEDLFDQVKASRGDRYGLLEEIAALLTAHSRAEEQQVYPAIDAAAPDHGQDVQRSTQEHDEAEELLENALQAVTLQGQDPKTALGTAETTADKQIADYNAKLGG